MSSKQRFSQMSGDKRRLTVLVTVLALVALVFVGRMVLSSSGGSSGTATPITADPSLRSRAAAVSKSKQPATKTPATTANAKSTGGSTQADGQVTPEQSSLPSATRDPFQPPFNPTPGTRSNIPRSDTNTTRAPTTPTS